MINRLLSILPVLALALLGQFAHAQTPTQSQPQTKPQSQAPAKPQQQSQAGYLYKSTMPDGKVIFGDAPTPGAVKVEKSKPDTSKKGITAATPKEMAAAKKLEERPAASAYPPANRAADLEMALRKMEAGREKFKEPLEGERIGTAGGGGRFTDGYLDRQKKYEQSIENLRKEVAKAQAAK